MHTSDERVEPTGEGDPHVWEEIWNELDTAGETVFTRESPKTLGSFVLRCYFEDLWSELGGRAKLHCLELGAGRGTTSMYLATAGCGVTLVDLAPRGLALARRNFA